MAVNAVIREKDSLIDEVMRHARGTRHDTRRPTAHCHHFYTHNTHRPPLPVWR